MWLWLLACSGARAPASEGVVVVGDLTLTPVVSGLTKPTEARFLGDRVVVAQQQGELVVAHGKELSTWLDLRTLPAPLKVVSGGERGLLGFDIDPDFARTGRVVLSWTATVGSQAVSTLALFRTDPAVPVGDAPLTVDRVLFTVPQPWSNHNGGGVRFGPGGRVFLGLGDGGKWGDPLRSGQDHTTPLGAMLRFDPDAPPPHIPPDNPFVDVAGAHPALFAIGLRNPWRFTFLATGELLAADVGQGEREEVTFVPPGANLGWNVKEGDLCYRVETCEGDFVDPIFVYDHTQGISITGGVIGQAGVLKGRYVVGDFGTGRLWSMRVSPSGAADVQMHGKASVRPSSFTLDSEGRTVLVDYSSGRLLQIGP